MRLRTTFYTVILCLILSACAAVASPTLTSASVATLTISPTTVHSTKTPTPGPTEEPSPMSVPPVVWAEPFSKHIELKGFEGIWSPTANEMVGTEKLGLPKDFNVTGTLVLASAPAFVTTVLDDAHKNTAIGSVIWSLDGLSVDYVIYKSPSGFTMSNGTFWTVARNASQLLSHGNSMGGFIGWMDARTLVHEGYIGGGQSFVAALDVLTNHSVAGDSISAAIKKIHSRYIPMVGCRDFCNVCVLPKTVNTSQVLNDSNVYVCQSEPGYPTDLRSFPRPKAYDRSIDTIFQDWQAGTNNMLILAQGQISDKPVSRLLLWNVDTNRVTSLAPGGLFGRFSPNGKLLVYITSGPSDQYTEKNAKNVPVDITISDAKQYLQLMNVSTGQILLRVPVKTYKGEDYSLNSSQEFLTPTALSFSPDGRYLTFQTIGPITLRDAHFPTEAVHGDTTVDYLHIFDLQEEKLIQSLPSKGSILWAPTSDKFLCKESDNWHLFELSTHAIRPITLSAGNQFVYPAWSYDGSYLSFSLDYDAADAAGTNKTFMLNLIPNP